MYDNRSRTAAANQTRRRVLAAAHDAFLTQGYAGTTIRAVATAAGVSQETVYKRFDGKAGLLKAVYDVTLAGDDEPVSMADRPQAQAVRAAKSAREAAGAYAAMAGALASRTGPLLDVVLNARGSDPELEAFAATIDTERLTGATMVTRHWSDLGLLRAELTVEQARDVVWTLISPAVNSLLRQRGWSRSQYEAWLSRTLLATVLREPTTEP